MYDTLLSGYTHTYSAKFTSKETTNAYSRIVFRDTHLSGWCIYACAWDFYLLIGFFAWNLHLCSREVFALFYMYNMVLRWACCTRAFVLECALGTCCPYHGFMSARWVQHHTGHPSVGYTIPTRAWGAHLCAVYTMPLRTVYLCLCRFTILTRDVGTGFFYLCVGLLMFPFRLYAAYVTGKSKA